MFVLVINGCFLFSFSCREGESGSWNRSVETHSNATSQYIDGLNPYTVYLFRVAAENALGYSKPGKESYPTLTHRERESYFLRDSQLKFSFDILLLLQILFKIKYKSEWRQQIMPKYKDCKLNELLITNKVVQ